MNRGKEPQEALNGLCAFFLGQDGAEGLPANFDKLADYEPVEVTLNAGAIRAALRSSSAPTTKQGD